MGGYSPMQAGTTGLLTAYEPTWRDKLARLLMGEQRPSPERARLVEGLTGSRGMGSPSLGLLDALPGVGQALQAQEAVRSGDTDMLAMALMPGSKQVKAATGSADDAAKAGIRAYHGSQQTETPRPGPGGRFPEAGATGASSVLAETSQTLAQLDPHVQAADAANALKAAFGRSFDVMLGGSAFGKSAYVRTPLGDIRFSDHAAGARPGQAWDFYSQPASADDVVNWYRTAEARSAERLAARQAQEAADREAKLAASAPQRATDEANRAAKEAFWRVNGLDEATATAKDKAWKQYKAGAFPPQQMAQEQPKQKGLLP